MTADTYYGANDTDQTVQWIATHTTFLIASLVVGAVLLALWLFLPEILAGSNRWSWAAAGRIAVNAYRSLAGWLTRPGSGGAHAKPRLAIAAAPFHSGEPVEAGEDECDGTPEPEGEPEPVEVYDPLTSPLTITEAAAPLHDAVPAVAVFDWNDFTGSWLAIDTTRLPDPDPAYTPWDTSDKLPALPAPEPETAGAR